MRNLIDLLNLRKKDIFEIFYIADKIQKGRFKIFLNGKALFYSKGIVAKVGRYGGTYTYKDIAFEFASWVPPQFKLYLIKEFERLKKEEAVAG